MDGSEEYLKRKLAKAEASLQIIRQGTVSRSWPTVKAAVDLWFGTDLSNQSNKSIETGPENTRGPDWFANDGIDFIIRPTSWIGVGYTDNMEI